MKNISGPLRGWAISLLLHAAALAWLMHQVAPPRPDDTPVRSSMMVFVTVRPPPPPEPKPAPKPEPKPASRAQAAAARPRASATPPQPVITSTNPAPAADSVQPATLSASPADGPVFDIDAARATARAVAKEGGSGARGGATLKETTDEKLGRAIEQSRRKDCKTRYSGMGVLAIIPLVKDTVTDTGCKW